MTRSTPLPLRGTSQRGITLIMVLIILVVISLLGVGGAQVALMSERGARNDRDQQVAWQSAEEGLVDAEIEMYNTAAGRRTTFDGVSAVNFPASGCGTSGATRGLCATAVTGEPTWLSADFTITSSAAPTVAFGTFSNQNQVLHAVPGIGTGLQPAQLPRYVIEPVRAPIGSKSEPAELWYRVTAMGFGPSAKIQTVVQMLYRN